MFLQLFSLLPLVQLSTSLSCTPCCRDEEEARLLNGEESLHCTACPPAPGYCASGELAKDVCGCCDVCAKALGEECGGL